MISKNFAVTLSVCLFCTLTLAAAPAFGQIFIDDDDKTSLISQSTALSGEFGAAKKDKRSKTETETAAAKQNKPPEKEAALSKEDKSKESEKDRNTDANKKTAALSKEDKEIAGDTKEAVLLKDEKTEDARNESDKDNDKKEKDDKAANLSKDVIATAAATEGGSTADFDAYMAQAAFKEIYYGDDLSVKEKEIIILVSLLSAGANEDQIKKQIIKALNAGLEPEKIIASFVQCTPYAGYPKVTNAVMIAKKVFSERKINFNKK